MTARIHKAAKKAAQRQHLAQVAIRLRWELLTAMVARDKSAGRIRIVKVKP